MKLHIKIFVEHDGEYILGPGRLELLRCVRDLGSLRQAAIKLGMSYRWAWGRLKKAETEFGCTLLEHTEESLRGRPKVLTREASELIAWFEKTETDLRAVLAEADGSMPVFFAAAPTGEKKKARQKSLPLD